MKKYKNLFNKIIEPENLFLAWDEFKKGKGSKIDVLEFEKNLEKNIFNLHRDLKNKTYRHGGYEGFYITDPKPRHIHKATVRDRVLHHTIFSTLNPVFEPTFIPTSFSCRIGKGNHVGVEAVTKMLRKESRNNTRTCYALKCDVKKFFDSINHEILQAALAQKISDTETMALIKEIISGYGTEEISELQRERERETALRANPKEYRLAILLPNFLPTCI